MTQLWVDDLRPPPDSCPSPINGELISDGWWWAKNSKAAIDSLFYHNVSPGWERFDVMSLDHDLGGDDTTRPIVLWLCEHPRAWPSEIRVHTANPVGREWLTGMIARYRPTHCVRDFCSASIDGYCVGGYGDGPYCHG